MSTAPATAYPSEFPTLPAHSSLSLDFLLSHPESYPSPLGVTVGFSLGLKLSHEKKQKDLKP